MLFFASLLMVSTLGAPGAPGAAQSAGTEVLQLRFAGSRTLLHDPKDAGLRAALELLRPRLAELSQGMGPGGPPPELMTLLGRFLTSPFQLAIGLEEDPAAELPFYAQLELQADSAGAASELAQELEQLLLSMGMEVMAGDEGGLQPLSAPMPAWFGPRGRDVVLAIGRASRGPIAPAPAQLPRGAEPALSMHVELDGLLEMMRRSGEEDPGLAELFRMLGLAGKSVTWSMGSDAERAYVLSAMPGAAAELRAKGLLPARALEKKSFAPVPADALWALVGANNLASMLALVGASMEQSMGGMGGASDPIALLSEELGFDVQQELLAHLGAAFGAYASDSTGGGGLSSIVGFAELADAAAFQQSLQRLEARLGELAAEGEMQGAQVRVLMQGGRRTSSLVFPGLPIPVQPCWTIAGAHFLVALSPQGLEAAMAQLRAGTGLADRPDLLEQLPEGFSNVYSLSFLDSPRLLRGGYGWTLALGSALTNALRSAEAPDQEPPLVMPSFRDLVAGAKPWLQVARVNGDDVLEIARMDRSMLVNATALFGLVDSMPMLAMVPMMAFTMLGARSSTSVDWGDMEYEEWDPSEGEVRSDLITLHFAVSEYMSRSGGRAPQSLAELLEADEDGYALVYDPENLVDPWGQPYHYEPAADGESMPRIHTLGRDGLPGGEGADADVDNLGILAEIESWQEQDESEEMIEEDEDGDGEDGDGEDG